MHGVGSEAVSAFIERWRGKEGGAERANYALFLIGLSRILGVPMPARSARSLARLAPKLPLPRRLPSKQKSLHECGGISGFPRLIALAQNERTHKRTCRLARVATKEFA